MKRNDIDALARLLEGDPPKEGVPEDARALGAIAQALSAASRPAPLMEHKAELRTALVDAARAQTARPPFLSRARGWMADTTARWRYSTRVGAATAASALALSGGGVAVAAQQALPDHPLYGVKLVLEDLRLAIIGDEVDRARLQLSYAERRMDEAQVSAVDGDMDAVLRALREADESSRNAARAIIAAAQDRDDPALLELLVDFSRLQRDRLTAMLPLLSGEAADVANDALVVLNRIDQRVAVLSGVCADCGAARDTRPGGRGGAGGARGAGGAGGADGAGDLADFDFAEIPPADEPFSPCPCAPAGTSDEVEDKPAEPARAGKDDVDDETDEKPGNKPDKEPKDPPPEEPDDDPLPELPEPVEDTKDEAEDVVDDVLDELPDPQPTPDLPPQGSSNSLPPLP